MPVGSDVLGFGNRWYPLAVKTAEHVMLRGEVPIRLIAAPVFVATKLVAFRDRGADDFLASHDLEDILTVVDNRPELLEEAQRGVGELRKFLAEEFSALLNNPSFMQAMPGHLPADGASQARLPELIQRLRKLADLDR